MARPYSNDLRERVVAAAARRGMSCREAAVQFGIGASTAIRWVAQYRRTGSVAPGQMGGHKPKSIAGADRDWLIERCRGGDFTLRGLVAELAERGLKVDYHTVWSFVHAEGLSFKKNRSGWRARSLRHRPPPGTVAHLSATDRSGSLGLHRRDMDQDQHGVAAWLGAEG
jgi:transposase